MKMKNSMRLLIPSKSINESFARSVISSFCLELDPTVEQINDIKTAVSEAVTNCIVHGYKDTIGDIYITAAIKENVVSISIRDKGIGIPNIEQATQPLFTTDTSDDRAGLGFAVMESFMDTLKVKSIIGKGTKVVMTKKIISRG